MTRSLSHLARQLVFCGAAGLCLSAETPRLGVQVQSSWPTGSMTSQFTDDTGYGFGFFADWEVDAGRTVRLAYDGLFYPSRKDSSPIAGMASPSVRSTISDRKPRTDSLTLQYLFFPSRDIEGFYLMAGLGAMKYQQKIDASVQLADASILTPTFLQTSGTRLACVAGAGYEFGKQWGVSGKYSFITVNNHTLGGVQAGLSYRF